MDIRRRACPQHSADSGGKSCLLRFPPLPLTCGARGGGMKARLDAQIHPGNRRRARPAKVALHRRISVVPVGTNLEAGQLPADLVRSHNLHETVQSLFLPAPGVNLISCGMEDLKHPPSHFCVPGGRLRSVISVWLYRLRPLRRGPPRSGPRSFPRPHGFAATLERKHSSRPDDRVRALGTPHRKTEDAGM